MAGEGQYTVFGWLHGEVRVEGRGGGWGVFFLLNPRQE